METLQSLTSAFVRAKVSLFAFVADFKIVAFESTEAVAAMSQFKLAVEDEGEGLFLQHDAAGGDFLAGDHVPAADARFARLNRGLFRDFDFVVDLRRKSKLMEIVFTGIHGSRLGNALIIVPFVPNQLDGLFKRTPVHVFVDKVHPVFGAGLHFRQFLDVVRGAFSRHGLTN